jgi:hypothetical protein
MNLKIQTESLNLEPFKNAFSVVLNVFDKG